MKPNYDLARQIMIQHQLIANGITDAPLLSAFDDVPRHLFVSRFQKHYAYSDRILSIGHGQTMLPPFVIAKMLQTMRLNQLEKVLEVGTGSGYLTALLMHLSHYAYSLERIPQLAEKASERWQELGLVNVDLHIGDGSQGLADMASYDAIIVTASVRKIPKPLALQLNPLGGRMVIPIGDAHQQKLKLIRREANQWHTRTIERVALPPMIGRYGEIPPSAGV
ncbi:MAG: protein-L-isoaspartate(D-aspartate) O-methyltransferase [Chloroflexota bacterium]